MRAVDRESFSERISSLRAELGACGKEIVTHITALYTEGSGGIVAQTNLKNDPRNAVKVLQHDVLDCLQEAKSRSDLRESYASDLNECKALLDVISKVSTASEKIVKLEEAVGGCDIKKTSALVTEVKDSLDDLPSPNSEIGTGAVCTSLRREARILRSRFQARVRRFLGNCIICEQGRVTVIKQLQGVVRGSGEDILLETAISLTDIWAALVATNSADESVDNVVDAIWNSVLRPLWREKKTQSPAIFTGEDTAELVFESVVNRALTSNTSSSSSTYQEAAAAAALGTCRLPMPQLLEYIGQALSFMTAEVFCGNESAIRRASVKLHSSPIYLMDTLVETLTLLVPKVEHELTQFQRATEKACRDFETKLVGLQIDRHRHSSSNNVATATAADIKTNSSSSSNNSSGSNSIVGAKNISLSEVVDNLAMRFAEIRRKEILGRARELLLSDYHNTMLAAGDALEDEPASAGDIGDPRAVLDRSGSLSMQTLQFESCQVSLAACRVLKLVHEVMKQACSASPQLAGILYQSARDCLELFIAIVPLRFADVIETVPRMGAVLYNDTCYMAHNCTLITHMYREELSRADPALTDSIGFIDFIPRFRSMGEKCLAAHVEEQRATLAELVARMNINPSADSSSSPTATAVFEGGLRAVGDGLLKNIAGRLNLVSSSAGSGSGALSGSGSGHATAAAGNHHKSSSNKPPPTTEEADCNNDAAAGLVLKHLERLSGQWKSVLQDVVYDRVLGYLVEGMLRLSMKPIIESDCVSENAGSDISRTFRTLQRTRSLFIDEKDEDTLCRLVASWRKFCALTDLLVYNLSEVAEWLPRRKFSSFTGGEMTSLIKALFEDTPRRRTVLNSILEMSS